MNNKLTRRNYDNIIRLYTERYDEFLIEVRKLIEKLIPNDNEYKPEIVVKRIDTVIPWMQEFMLVLGNKAKSCNEIMLHVLK